MTVLTPVLALFGEGQSIHQTAWSLVIGVLEPRQDQG